MNGSGKTTLLNCITGVDSSFLPRHFVECADRRRLSLKASPESLPPETRLYQREMPVFYGGIRRAQNGLTYGEFYPDWSVRDYSSYLSRLDVDPSKRVYQLSKGEFMKMQTCFALAHHPDFLFLDEPLEGFDPVFRREFLDLLGELLDRDMGILLSTLHYGRRGPAGGLSSDSLENGRLTADASSRGSERPVQRTYGSIRAAHPGSSGTGTFPADLPAHNAYDRNLLIPQGGIL